MKFLGVLIAAMVLASAAAWALTIIESTKFNTYTIVGPPSAVAASKFNTYIILGPPSPGIPSRAPLTHW
jgi:hypothetical protein